MKWNKVIQADGNSDFKDMYSVTYSHENYSAYINPIDGENFEFIQFNNSINAKSVELGISINNYDIIKELGEDNI